MDRAVKQAPSAGRPRGALSRDPVAALAFGEAVKEIRIQAGVAQEDLAHRADIDRSYMSRIERGLHIVNFSMILRIANVLGCTPGTLVDHAAAKIGKKPPAKKAIRVTKPATKKPAAAKR